MTDYPTSETFFSKSLYCLDITKDGHPAHPLYQKAELKPRLFREAVKEDHDDRAE